MFDFLPFWFLFHHNSQNHGVEEEWKNIIRHLWRPIILWLLRKFIPYVYMNPLFVPSFHRPQDLPTVINHSISSRKYTSLPNEDVLENPNKFVILKFIWCQPPLPVPSPHFMTSSLNRLFHKRLCFSIRAFKKASMEGVMAPPTKV